jgi:epsilon-lactone hydrolase
MAGSPLLVFFRMMAALFGTLLRRARRGPFRPGWSLPFEVSVALLRATTRFAAGRPASEQRAIWHALPGAKKLARTLVTESELELAGFRARRLQPAGAEPVDSIIYMHGGAFIWGAYAQYAEVLGHLARATGAAVIWCDIPLAPEQPHPAALQATRRILQAVQQQPAVPGSRVFIAGDSSGGNLALAAALAIRDAGERLPDGCILLSPWVDLASQVGSQIDNQIDWGKPGDLDSWARVHAAGADLTLPALSPGRADPRGLCPTLALYGERELLRDQIEAWVQKARAAAVPVTARMFPEMVHGWFMLPAFTPQAGLAYQAIADFVGPARA